MLPRSGGKLAILARPRFPAFFSLEGFFCQVFSGLLIANFYVIFMLFFTWSIELFCNQYIYFCTCNVVVSSNKALVAVPHWMSQHESSNRLFDECSNEKLAPWPNSPPLYAALNLGNFILPYSKKIKDSVK